MIKVRLGERTARCRARWSLPATLVGAVIGAGFATGRELLQFFAFHGAWGYAGVLLAGYLFWWFGGVLTEYQDQKHPETYGDLFRWTCGPIIGTLLDWLTTAFLFVGLSVTLAGLAALLVQQWSVPRGAAIAVAAAVCIGVAAFGARGVVGFNGIIVPVLLSLILALCVLEWVTPVKSPGIRPVLESANQVAVSAWAWGSPDRPPTPHWATSALLYFAYNIVLFVTTLVAVSARSTSQLMLNFAAGRSREEKHRLVVSQGRLAGLLIGGLAFLLVSVIEPQTAAVAELPIPMAGLAAGHGPVASLAFAVCLALALLTTAIAQMFGTAARMTPDAASVSLTAALITLAALPIAALGFTRLLAVVYPAMGIVGLLFAILFALSVLRWV